MCTDRSVLQFAGPLVGLCCTIFTWRCWRCQNWWEDRPRLFMRYILSEHGPILKKELHVHCQQVGNGCRLNEKTTLPGFCFWSGLNMFKRDFFLVRWCPYIQARQARDLWGVSLRLGCCRVSCLFFWAFWCLGVLDTDMSWTWLNNVKDQDPGKLFQWLLGAKDLASGVPNLVLPRHWRIHRSFRQVALQDPASWIAMS